MSVHTVPESATAMHVAHMMRVRRRLLAESPRLQRQAITDFVLSTARAAQELSQFNAIEGQIGSLPPESEQAAMYLHDMIRARYRECFGTEMGQ